MAATPARIGFVTRGFRLASRGPDATVVANHGALARDVVPEQPIETFFVRVEDADAVCNERYNLMRGERRRFIATMGGYEKQPPAETVLSLSLATSLPCAAIIDSEGNATLTGIDIAHSVDLDTGAAEMTVWG